MESQEHSRSRTVNNAIYSELGQRWYEADDDPVALLRAESKLRNPWVAGKLAELGPGPHEILDIGCGGGFLTNYLASLGHTVTGLDESEEALVVARSRDQTNRVSYLTGDALRLPFEDGSFDVVCAMDFLEHVEDPALAVREASRVLRPGGMFFFHTFNRNPLAWLVIIKGVEWFVKNTPDHMHILELFIKPRELSKMCLDAGLEEPHFVGTRPRVGAAFWKMLWTRVVPRDFEFTFTPSTLLAFSGFTRRTPVFS